MTGLTIRRGAAAVQWPGQDQGLIWNVPLENRERLAPKVMITYHSHPAGSAHLMRGV
jgi:hypothetical protein